MKTLVIFTILLVQILATTRSYTLFKQCDSSWGGQQLGTSSKTICSSGCLMSSVSMILNTYGIKVNGLVSNPSTLNNWLKKNGGYVSGDSFVWDSTRPLGLPFSGFESLSQTHSLFDQGYHIILNVNKGGHFVLMTGYNGNTFYVNDPGFSRTSYEMSEVVKAGAYKTAHLEYFLKQLMKV